MCVNKISAFDEVKSFSSETLDLVEGVSDEMPQLTAESTEDDILSYMFLVFARHFGNEVAFKGGYMLKQLIKDSRYTRDIDFSIETEKNYQKAKHIMKSIIDYFLKIDLISSYEIKDSISPTSSGGMSFKLKRDGRSLGIDIGLHSLSYGTHIYSLEILPINGFSIERMLADKVSAILSRKRFRRAKDLYDLYILLGLFDVSYLEFTQCVSRRNPEWENIPFSDTILGEYEKAWNKLVLRSAADKDIVLNKPDFFQTIELFYQFALPVKDEYVFKFWDHVEKTWRH